MKTIEIKGIGTYKAPVDYVVLTMNLKSVHMSYEKMMDISAEKVEKLSNALMSIGFEKEALKTLDFQIETEEKYRNDSNGNGEWVFAGYKVEQELKLEFDFDSKRLGQVLSAVSTSGAEPRINIEFTIKHQDEVKAELLRSATKNAREKAEILCDASGVKLGELMAIDYNWGEIRLCSETDIKMMRSIAEEPMVGGMEMTPEDVSASDTVTFVWAIE